MLASDWFQFTAGLNDEIRVRIISIYRTLKITFASELFQFTVSLRHKVASVRFQFTAALSDKIRVRNISIYREPETQTRVQSISIYRSSD